MACGFSAPSHRHHTGKWGLRDYGCAGQLGLEPTPAEYVTNMVEVFGLVRELLADDGVLWLNLGDSYATGAGKVGDCPGGGKQGEAWKQYGPARAQVPDGKNAAANIPTYQPNRMPIAGLKPKDLCGIPWRVAFALQADGWYLRQDIIWAKPNPMPESVTDRCTKSHEYLFLLAKSERYYMNMAAISEPATKAGKVLHGYGTGAKDRMDVSESNDRRTRIGLADWDQPQPDARNRRSVWTIATQPYAEAHFATFPRALVAPCIMAGSRVGDTVLDPFMGSGTVGQVAQDLGRKWLGCELNPDYIKLADRRTAQQGMALQAAD